MEKIFTESLAEQFNEIDLNLPMDRGGTALLWLKQQYEDLQQSQLRIEPFQVESSIGVEVSSSDAEQVLMVTRISPVLLMVFASNGFNDPQISLWKLNKIKQVWHLEGGAVGRTEVEQKDEVKSLQDLLPHP